MLEMKTLPSTMPSDPSDTSGTGEGVAGGREFLRFFERWVRGAGTFAADPRLEKFHLPPLPRTRCSSGPRSVSELTCSEREKISGAKSTPTSSDLAFRKGS